jgi:UDP-3-O-[3-hydroxymyristoyl] N-acetylglucosamine deacetylase
MFLLPMGQAGDNPKACGGGRGRPCPHPQLKSVQLGPMNFKQKTLASPVSCSGVGLHSGKQVNLTIHPAPVNYGIKFVRTDLPDSPAVSALFNSVVDTSLATVIGYDGFIVSTIEHLMASFAGLSVDNARVEMDAYEVPVMDGSAGPFTEMLLKAGIQEQEAPRHYFFLKKPVVLEDESKSVRAYPDSRFRITCIIDFAHPLIRQQTYSIDLTHQGFAGKIAKARTFGFLYEIEYLKRYGLARGGSLENAVVVDEKGILNDEGLRYPDEFVRHKLLDCIGDFALLGMPLLAHIRAEKSGHAFNHAFLKKFLASRDAWEARAIRSLQDLPHL